MAENHPEPRSPGRRAFLNKAVLGAAGVGAAYTLEEKILLAALKKGADQKKPGPTIPPGSLPRGKIGNVSISRLFLGGNLIGGWAHSRDLMYVSTLFRAYNTKAKIFETLALAEQCGINTALVDPAVWGTVKEYHRQGGKIQTMVCIHPDPNTAQMKTEIKTLVDQGATLLYTHGEATDMLNLGGKLDVLGKAMDLIKAQGVPAGIGSHSLETPIACEKNRLHADYYVKTFHHDRYWSATPKKNRHERCWYDGFKADHDQYHDNLWCVDPEKTAAFMEKVDKPWVAFKVMAAGAIYPRHGFSFAFRGGADFVVAGMFDFQVAEDVKIAAEVLSHIKTRKRPWRG